MSHQHLTCLYFILYTGVPTGCCCFCWTASHFRRESSLTCHPSALLPLPNASHIFSVCCNERAVGAPFANMESLITSCCVDDWKLLSAASLLPVVWDGPLGSDSPPLKSIRLRNPPEKNVFTMLHFCFYRTLCSCCFCWTAIFLWRGSPVKSSWNQLLQDQSQGAQQRRVQCPLGVTPPHEGGHVIWSFIPEWGSDGAQMQHSSSVCFYLLCRPVWHLTHAVP